MSMQILEAHFESVLSGFEHIKGNSSCNSLYDIIIEACSLDLSPNGAQFPIDKRSVHFSLAGRKVTVMSVDILNE